jgi:hypothetical protein
LLMRRQLKAESHKVSRLQFTELAFRNEGLSLEQA